ncbi:MAG: hypothetical protein MUC67_09715 [Acidobacteria bacterium]|jgi:hypothetical protein|nr:hypothetical protein [Acidobacteriota bacterium]MCU0253592.1 hypothetical protein [Acidobacteriota bacterium]
MRTIVNRTVQPLAVRLPRGKVLHLGPGKSGQIADDAVDAPGVVKLVEGGQIELLAEGEQARTGGGSSGTIHTDTHGHHGSAGPKTRGDRGA